VTALDAVAASLAGRAVPDQPLGARTTYRVGGHAALLVEAHGEDDLVAVHRALVAAGDPVPLLVVGQGSNLLVADTGFPGLVVVLGGEFDFVDVHDTTVRAGGSASLPKVARKSAAAGLRGLEWGVGVPGSVGGALRMNAGGHGSDIAAVLDQCRLFDLSAGEAAVWGPDRLGLGYRRSDVGPGDAVVWAEFALTVGDRDAAMEAVTEVVRWRREHQPGGSNAGSVFTNPAGDSAGRLVDEAGLKGLRMGSAQVSPKHANFIQADSGGSADDVHRLIDYVRSVVADRTGVVLEPEVRLVGFAGDALPLVHAGPEPQTPPARAEVSTSSRGRDLSGSPTPDDPMPAVEPRLWQRRMAVLRDQSRRRLRWIIAALCAVVAATAVLVTLHSPVLAVRNVTVDGVHRTDPAAVVAAARVGGSPLVDIDTGASAARVEQLPWVAHATVVRSWPDGVTITVTERVPVAVVDRPGGGVAVVDGSGHVLELAATAPPGLLTLGAVAVPGGPGSVLGPAAGPALAVADALPATLAPGVRRLAVTAGHRVWLDLGGGVSAALGGGAHMGAKLQSLASVLASAHPTGPAVIDVTVPDLPTVGPPAAGAPPWRGAA